MKKRSFIRSLTLACLALTISPLAMAQSDGLLIYCGITMVRPITELATNFERREHIKIRIAQGGSEDLYQSVRKSRLGDLYLPGEPSYRDKYLSEGLLGDYKVVGYNQLAIMVQKGNPKKVKPELKELLRKDLVLMIGNAQSGSVGLETRQTLDRFNLYPQAVSKAAFLMPDSRSLALSLKRGEADVTLSWRATAFFPDNAPHMDTIDLDPKITPPQGLLLIQLTFSRNQEMARKFSDYVASPEGQATFRKFGFLDANQKS